MQEYFIFFIVTIVISLFAEIIKKENCILFLFVSILIALPLSFLAGIRTIDIGTDMLVYGAPNFKTAQLYSSFFDYVKNETTSGGTEVGYATVNYIVSIFTNNLNVLMFVVSLITLVSFIYASFRFKKELDVSVTLQIIIFFCLFYGSSLNLMRQTLAVSFIYLSMSYFLLERNKPNFLKGSFFLLVAILFHRSAIIIVPFIIIFCMDWQEDSFPKNAIKSLLIFVVFIVFFTQFQSFASSYVLKYSRYLGIGGTSDQAQGGQPFLKALQSSLMPLFIIIALLFRSKGNFFRNKIGKQINLSKSFILVIMFLNIIFQVVSSSNVVVGRIGLFFEIFEPLFIPVTVKFTIPKKARIVFYILICAYLLLAFYIYTVNGYNSIYPYRSILGI